MNTLCIYHGNCADGFGSAWVVRKALGEKNVEFFPGVHGEQPPDCTDRDVLIVDFSYKLPEMERIINEARSVTILDHHKTAEKDLRFLLQEGIVRGHFDMDRSGAMMAWEWFFPNLAPPQFIEHIQDRDLWEFQLEGTEEVMAAIFSYPYDFEVWEYFTTDNLKQEGKALLRKHKRDIAMLIERTQRRMIIAGHDVPVVNMPHMMASDACNQLAKGEPFAACYMDTPEGRAFSLRSAPDGLDVSEIAERFGGGGHYHAAGFSMPIGWEGEQQ